MRPLKAGGITGASPSDRVCLKRVPWVRWGRGLYVCEACDTIANAEVNGAENIRQKVLPSLAADGGDRVDILLRVNAEES